MRKIHTIWYVIIPCPKMVTISYPFFIISYLPVLFHTCSCHFIPFTYQFMSPHESFHTLGSPFHTLQILIHTWVCDQCIGVEKHLSKMPQEPALRNACRGPRTSLPQRAFHPTNHVLQNIHPTDNPPQSRRRRKAGRERHDVESDSPYALRPCDRQPRGLTFQLKDLATGLLFSPNKYFSARAYRSGYCSRG